MLVFTHKSGYIREKSQLSVKSPIIHSKNDPIKKVKNINKKNHRRGKRNSIQVKQHKFCAIGVNANGIKGKWSTFKNVVNKIKPLIWNIQETKKHCQVEVQKEYIWTSFSNHRENS